MYSNEHTLQDLLSSIFTKMDLNAAADEVDAKRVYREVVGDLISRLTQSLSYKNKILYVGLSSAALAKELSMKKSSLILKINTQIGRDVITDIIFR